MEVYVFAIAFYMSTFVVVVAKVGVVMFFNSVFYLFIYLFLFVVVVVFFTLSLREEMFW